MRLSEAVSKIKHYFRYLNQNENQDTDVDGSESGLKTPIFVYEPATLLVFSTKARAEAYMEAIDVNNGEYTEAYDADGNVLKISTTSDNDVIVEQMTPLVNKSDDLRKLLYEFFKSSKKKQLVTDSWLAGASLDELVTKALEFKTW